MRTELMFSSKTDLWETPQELFDELNHEFHFNLDVTGGRDKTEDLSFPKMFHQRTKSSKTRKICNVFCPKASCFSKRYRMRAEKRIK